MRQSLISLHGLSFDTLDPGHSPRMTPVVVRDFRPYAIALP